MLEMVNVGLLVLLASVGWLETCLLQGRTVLCHSMEQHAACEAAPGVQAQAQAGSLADGDREHAAEGEAHWRRLRREQLGAQQQREMQALLARCTCQRDDLEKQLLQTLERHDRRCSAVVAVRLGQPPAPVACRQHVRMCCVAS